MSFLPAVSLVVEIKHAAPAAHKPPWRAAGVALPAATPAIFTGRGGISVPENYWAFS
jgi:hypothetical protein